MERVPCLKILQLQSIITKYILFFEIMLSKGVKDLNKIIALSWGNIYALYLLYRYRVGGWLTKDISEPALACT